VWFTRFKTFLPYPLVELFFSYHFMPEVASFTFVWDVTDDDKDHDSLDTAAVRHRGNNQAICLVDSGRNSRWDNWTSHSLSAQCNPVMECSDSDLSNYELVLSHSPVGSDKFNFNFRLMGFDSRGNETYRNNWSHLRHGYDGRNSTTEIIRSLR
jgi:hypothetical protein